MLSAFLILAACTAATLSTPQADARTAILAGLTEIPSPGIPGTMAAIQSQAAVIATGRTDARTQGPVIIAAEYGAGRVVGFGHDGYFGADSNPQLMHNAARWASRKAEPRVGVVGNQLHTLLAGRSASIQVATVAQAKEYDVLATTDTNLSADQIESLRRYVAEGGGLLLGSTGWGWMQITGRPITEHPFNALCAPMGLVWSSNMLQRTARNGFDVEQSPRDLAHAGRALQALEGDVPEADAPQAVTSVLEAALAIPGRDQPFASRLEKLIKGREFNPPSEEDPVTLRQPLRRIWLAMTTRQAEQGLLEGAHPAAEKFPGPMNPRIGNGGHTREFTIGPGWISTGLYAGPGTEMTYQGPGRVRVGAHSDSIWHLETWKRAPVVSLVFDGGRFQSPFGGLIYVELPPELVRQRRGDKISVEFGRSQEAPYFVLGKTTPEQWRRARELAAPWAELATDKLILTVPSEAIRQLDDPERLMRFWDDVMDACADLAAMPRERARPERIVADVQISAGYMHAGYPIMTHLDAVGLSLDVDRLRKEGSWGHFHEIGHNHQSSDWTFEGTGEVTVNLFTMYVYDKVLGHRFDSGHPAIQDRDARNRRILKHIEEGAPYDKWTSDPFLALMMYIQVIEEFGWEPIRETFAAYRGLPAGERPRTDQQKRDQWMVRLSRTLNRNLGPFFEIWGVPTSAAARESIADLPGWMPEVLRAQWRGD